MQPKNSLLERNLIDNMRNGYAECRIIIENGRAVDFIYEKVNARFEILTGLKNVVGKRVSEIISDIHEINPELLEIYGRVATTSQPEQFECYVNALNIWFDISVFSIKKGHFIAVFENITEHKQTDTARRKSELQFLTYFEDHAAVMLLLDPETGNIINANQAAANFYGWSAGELKQMCIGQITSVSAEMVKVNMKKAISSKQNRFMFRHKRADGSDRDVEVFGNKIVFEGKDLLYAIVYDCTERSLVEKALKQSEKRFKVLFEGHIAIKLIIDPDTGTIIDANPAAAAFYGWPVETLRRMRIQEINTLAPEQVMGEMEKARTSLNNHFIFRHRRADGSLCDVEVYSNKIEIAGKSLLYSIIHDVTGRKLAENYLQKLNIVIPQQSPAIVVVTDRAGHLEYVNPIFTKITGYSAEEIRGKNPRILQSGLTKKSVYEDLWNTILSGNIWRGELQNRKKNGELYWELTVISAIINDVGEITNFVAVKVDITEEKKMLADVINVKNEALQSDHIKTTFLANICHDLRNPMNGILGFTNLLKEPLLSEETQAEYIGLIQKSGEHILNLINELIDISRIETGKSILQIQEIHVNNLLHDVESFFRLNAQKNGVDLTFATGLPDSESIIQTDSLKLKQILINLLQNALKFTNQGSINFGYTKTNGSLTFYVSDSGIGIPLDIQGKIFDRFYQGDPPSSGIEKGSGLGLSISKAYVEMLGGSIRVESAINKGSTFIFTIPYIHPDSSTTDQLSSDTQESVLNIPGLTILIAEDDCISTFLLKKILSCNNLTIHYAENGQQAVELVKQYPKINLVLMDLQMPLIDGFEATRLIKLFRPDLPVIAQTALHSKEDRVITNEAGFDGFISKPIDKKELLGLMRKLLIVG